MAVRKQTGSIDGMRREPAHAATLAARGPEGRTVPLDRYRSIVFPNRLREQRRLHGFTALLGLAGALPTIPYIRLSKIERGEVVARADELQAIGATLGIAPADLLIDITRPDFNMAQWVAQRGGQLDFDEASEELAVLLAAAFRKARQVDRDLTLATLESDYGLAPVIVSRIENAVKTPDRWNAATTRAICAVLDVPDFVALEAMLHAAYGTGMLDPWLDRLPGEASRQRRTAERVSELRAQLGDGVPVLHLVPAAPPPVASARTLAVFGAPLADGLIAATFTDATVEAPQAAGPASFALRMCRATLGAGMPANAVLVVDPDVLPVSGALAVLREGDAYRVVSVGADRNGALTGYSIHPDKQIALDSLDSASVLAVIAAYFP